MVDDLPLRSEKEIANIPIHRHPPDFNSDSGCSRHFSLGNDGMGRSGLFSRPARVNLVA
jgi:hypothetical protein